MNESACCQTNFGLLVMITIMMIMIYPDELGMMECLSDVTQLARPAAVDGVTVSIWIRHVYFTSHLTISIGGCDDTLLLPPKAGKITTSWQKIHNGKTAMR
jgi:hypothetical protein